MQVQRSAEKSFRQLTSSKTGEHYSRSAVLFEALGALFVHHEILAPGHRSSAPHRHDQAEELIYILHGEVIAHEGTTATPLSPGDSVRFEQHGEQLHWIENRSEQPAEFLVIRPRVAGNDTRF